MSGNVPAHPVLAQQAGTYEAIQHLGLSKRERFAMAAMQGLLSDRRTMTDIGEAFAAASNHEQGSNQHTAGIRKLISMISVAHADALIAELNKETP